MAGGMDASLTRDASTSASNMTTDDDLNTTMSSISSDGESISQCYFPLFVIKLTTLVIAMLMMTATLATIACHHRLRKRHHIFPCNLVLSDLSGAVVFACFEGFQEEPPRELYMFLVILLATSILVSLLSIVLVTVYQFITIRVDPFGALNVITTPRLIVTCVLTWGISFAVSSVIAVTEDDHLFFFLLSISWTTTIITGLCYVLIYRSVAKVPCVGNITRERKEQNQRVLRTFGLVFGTTVLCWICPWVNWSLMSMRDVESHCLNTAGDIMINVNWIANSVIYWWRLRVFRSMFVLRRKQRDTVDNTQTSQVSDMKLEVMADPLI